VLPFSVQLRAGDPISDQVVLAVERAQVSGVLRPGDRFPSVRALSRELRINPNTAHKIIATLVDHGLLEVRPGIGTRVTEPPPGRRDETGALLGEQLERLVIEARRLGLDLDRVREALEEQWSRLSAPPEEDLPPRRRATG
jgi:GntR family transcriptional regulator